MDVPQESLTFDFGPFEEVHRWRKMPECDEFVGDKRSKHTVVHYQGSLYVFGGDNGKSMLNDLLRFDAKEMSWGRALVNGTPPAPRYHHSAVVYDTSMFVFGGYTGDIHSNSNLTNRNDLWEYKFSTGQWTEWHCTLGSRRPVPRSAHGSAVSPDGKLVIFAGYDGNVRLNDMWEIDLKQSVSAACWREVDFGSDVEAPPACCNFPVAVTGDSMFVFSGSIGAPKVSQSSSDLFRYHFGSRAWDRIGAQHILRGGSGSSCPPTRRYGHTMVSHRNQLYIFGGAADKTLPNELHCFDLDSETWSAVDVGGHQSEAGPSAEIPMGRLFHASAVVEDAMYIFGGTIIDNKHRSGEIFRIQMANFPKCTLHDDFGKLLSTGQLADLRFVPAAGGGGGEYHAAAAAATDPPPVLAHIAMVAARSEHLRNRIRNAKSSLAGGGGGGDMLIVAVPEADEKALRLVLEFIYTDKIDPTRGDRSLAGSDQVVRDMMEVYTLAVAFQMGRLEQLCAHYLESAVSVGNVLAALTSCASQMPALHFFKEFCLRFIIKDSNYNQVVMSQEFERLDKSIMVEVVRRHTQSTSCRHLTAENSPGGPPLTVPPPAAVSPRQHIPAAVGSSLEEDMHRFLMATGREFSDFNLVLDGSEIPTHRAILASRSSYFEAMFRSYSPQDNRVEICIGDIVPSRQSLSSLLRYIYHGEVRMPPEDSLYLFTAPSFYIFANQRLQVFCKQNLERNVSVDNVIQILEAADRSGTQDMKRYALNICVKHYPEVARLPKLKTLSKDLLLDILQALADCRVHQETADVSSAAHPYRFDP